MGKTKQGVRDLNRVGPRRKRAESQPFIPPETIYDDPEGIEELPKALWDNEAYNHAINEWKKH